MSSFVTIFKEALETCADKEQQLKLIKQFCEEGGQFRVKVVVEHSDPDTAEAIQHVASKYVPTKSIVTLMLKGATNEYQKAKSAFLVAASAQPISGEGELYEDPCN